MNNFCFLNLVTYIAYNSSFSVILCISLFYLPSCVLVSALLREFVMEYCGWLYILTISKLQQTAKQFSRGKRNKN